jgi:acyl-CoA synthetase (AMP-forming)/AMP-acid ligase II
MIHRSPFPDVELPAEYLTDYVLARAHELEDKAALVDGPSGRTLTYGALLRDVRALAGGLVQRGFEPGQTLAVLAPNLPEYAVVFHGVAYAGGVITTINPTYTEREIHHQLVDADARLLVTVTPFLDVAKAAAQGTAVEEIYTIDQTEGVGSLTDLVGEPLTEQVPVDLDSSVVVPYSSGTTGVNKGVMLTHRNLVSNITQTLAVGEVREDETLIAVLPFFHIYAMQVLMNTGLRVGATIVTMPRFELEQFLSIHQQYGVTRSFVVPPIVLALARHPVVDDYDLSTVERVFSAAAPLSAELALETGKRLACDVVQGYGMTELSPVSHLTPVGQFKPGSVGVTVPNTETRIVDPLAGEDVDLGVDGEVWVRGPQVMKGYLNNEQATAATITVDGWLRTGDIGHVDEDGHLFVVDRLKELIKYKGFQVPPAELEALLLTHPAVDDAAVVGIPDVEAGEIPAAYVVKHPGTVATAEEIMEYVASQVAHYKQVRRLEFIEAIPKSPTGKLLRRELKRQALGDATA